MRANLDTLQCRIKEHARLLIFNMLPPACLSIFGFYPFCLFIQFSLKRHCTVNKTYHYIVKCTQTVHSANSEPKLSLIVIIFNTLSPNCSLDFQKKSTLLDYPISVKFPPCSFIPSCPFIEYEKTTTV